MTNRKAFIDRLDRRTLLMIGASIASLASGLAVTPAHAQSTLSGIMSARASAPKPPAQGPQTTPQRGATMTGALSRQRSTISRAEQIRAYVLSARDAVIAANRGNVTDGLSKDGLDPTDTIRDAVAAARAGNTDRANELLVSASANLDDTGLKTWQGAGLPTQTTTSDGKVKVTIDQTQERALLSWNSFNIGANTTLKFNQQQNGVAQPGWVAVNRVTNSIAPSQILGNLQADGTVVVLNPSGIIFGQNSQVNTHSLLASTLEIGNAARFVIGNGGATQATTIKERNSAFLENGLFTQPNGTAGQIGNNLGAALLVSGMTTGNGKSFADVPEGAISIDRGAQISGTSGGFVILTAPDIANAGRISSVDGQVSLQAGRAVVFDQSTGAATSIDPFVRGYRLNTYAYGPQSGGNIENSGLIDSVRGYLSLGAGSNGSIVNSGLLSTTTSVSRNGKISITAGTVRLVGNDNPTLASGIVMLEDGNGETIPLGSANEPAQFKSSQLEIGAQVSLSQQPIGALVATDFSMERNALILAPGADVSIGVSKIPVEFQRDFDVSNPGRIDIAPGAIIDVSGLKDVQLPASRNQIEITPVKRGELRDTPNYREVVLDGNFSLNGATLYIDPRITGVRDDGVAWVGSPLIEASSLSSQISATAAEFMTVGGRVSLATSDLSNFSNVSAATAPSVHVAPGAVIDISGGWVNYAAGSIKTSKLITNDGRVVDISQANPNDIYVGVAEGFSSVQPRFGVLTTFLNPTTETRRYDQSYDEGRDAGALAVNAPAVAIDGTIFGNAFAGARQINQSDRPSTLSQNNGRSTQRTRYELPSGGALSIASLGDMIVYHGSRGALESDRSELLLNDAMITSAGFSELSLSAAGSITFADANPSTLQQNGVLQITGASDVGLVPGGILNVEAGRSIRFDGTVDVPSGVINASTILIGKTTDPTATGLLDSNKSNGSAFRIGLYGSGSGDDLSPNYLYSEDPGAINPFDIFVTGKLSTAGRWVNDFTQAGVKDGGAFSNGGTITLTVAPRVFAAIGGSLSTATEAVDLSGSIHVSGVLDVSSGGYVTSTGGLTLDGRGGNVSLTNATTYASSTLTFNGGLNGDDSGTAGGDKPIEGTNQSVEFTPVPGAANADAVFPALVPSPRSTVDIGSASIIGFGFAGGGTFTLVAPDISFASDNRAGSTHIGLDFFKQTGFGTLDISTYRSRIVDDLFANERNSKSAFFDTTRFVVGAGETFDLTQWMLPTLLNADQGRALRNLGTGSNVAAQTYLAPTTNVALWDRRSANLVLGGLTELDVLSGGQITGAPAAKITTSKLYNAGSIVLHGGVVQQRNDLPTSFLVGGLGVTDLSDAFGGPRDTAGRFFEASLNAAGVADPNSSGRLLSNSELVTREGADRLIYFTGMVGEAEGIVLANGSQTDLSGIALVDPRAALRTNGLRIRSGRVIDGGTLQLAASTVLNRQVAQNGQTGSSRSFLTGKTLVRADGAALNISGASLVVDQAAGMGIYVPYEEWSKGGTISALSGGSLGSTPIAAQGGSSHAEGGTLEWLDPTITSGSHSSNELSAKLIADSGFDTVIARGSLTLDGSFSLGLRRALIVTSREPLQAGQLFGDDANVAIGATAGTNATINASYIRFASRRGVTSFATDVAGDGQATFVGGAQGIDITGGVGFNGSLASVKLRTAGDIRFIGVNDELPGSLPAYNGQLVAAGDLLLDGRRVYATTGTGNLQNLLEGGDARRSNPFDVAVLGEHTLTIGNTYLDANAPAPLSAGSHLRLLGTTIVQNGFLSVPLGLLEIGSNSSVLLAAGSGFIVGPTERITFGEGSVTSVSGAGLNVPYGTTSDGKEYYFPTSGAPITKLPTGELDLAAASIMQESGARFDGRGGGDVYAYEFQSGVGGSRDLLDRFNRDPFSSNGYDPATGIGYQFADQRQVFALVPVAQLGKIAPYDPIYSADYGAAGPADLYGASAGRSVHLDGGNGISAGEYLLVPAKYAMAVPGALRLVENTDARAPLPGTSTRLLDGSVVVGGTFGYAGTDISESTRRSFTVQTKDTFLKYSQIITTGGSQYLTDVAAKNGAGRPRLPLDAARVVLAPLNELRVAGVFDTTAVGGGQGGQFDLLGQSIRIVGADGEAATGTLLITDQTLTALNATSLLIGGRRTENIDGTTSIAATATDLTVAGGAKLQAPEILLAVSGNESKVTVEDGASLAAIGNVGTQSSSDYISTSGGSLVRLANGAERLVSRSGVGSSTIEIGAATIAGDALVLDSSGNFHASDRANLAAKWIAISGQAIQFGGDQAEGRPGIIGSALEAKLAAADRVTVRSPGSIRFSVGTHRFNDLVLDTAALAVGTETAGGIVTVDGNDVRLLNSSGAASGCVAASDCGLADGFALNSSTLSFDANAMQAAGFTQSVSLSANEGMYIEGKGSFSSGSTSLVLRTPFVADRADAADPRDQTIQPDYSFLTTGDFGMNAAGTNGAAKIEGNGAPGTRIAIGTIDSRVRSVAIDGSRIRATAGVIDVQSDGDIAVRGGSLEVPGYERIFGDEVDPVTVSAGGGTINLFTANGGIMADSRTSLVSDTGVGSAGKINLLAGHGSVAVDAVINSEAKGPRRGSLTLDSGTTAVDLATFVDRYGEIFGGDVWIRAGVGDLMLNRGQTLKATSFTLTADSGAITIGGTIDTSGLDVTGMDADAARNAIVNGGDISLWGGAGVTLAATAKLDAHTTGYAETDSRPASAGNVTIGIASDAAAITIDQGATIDVGARRTQAEPGIGRLVPQVITDPATGTPTTVYRYAEPDLGGTVTFRAPVIGDGRNKVALSQRGSIHGAEAIQLEAFQRYDLDQMVAKGLYSGISRSSDGAILLDFAATGANPFTENFTLADGTSSLVKFIQDFNISTVDGSNLDGMRLRPGVELAARGDVTTVSQWNLAAATFSPEQLQAAVDAGVLQIIPELSTAGQTQFKVVPGKEGELLDRFTTFLYRVNGVARGEAPVVTMRAGGNLTINRSISDGFFTFRDKSDPNYINYQLGGGDRSYSPALQFSCGGALGTCSALASYGSGSNPGAARTLTISLGSAAIRGDQGAGSQFINSPLAIGGNGAAGAVDAAGNPIGDALGFGELFPLLPDDTAIHSSDLRLVAGASQGLSANPMLVDRASKADATVGGEFTYRLSPTGTANYDGPLQFHLFRPAGDGANINFDINDTFDLTDTTAGLDNIPSDAFTQLTWGSSAGLGADARAAALIYFAGKGYSFSGSAANPTGIAAPLTEVIGFLNYFEGTYQAGLASGRPGYSADRRVPLLSFGAANEAHVKTYVRSGDGDIAVAAPRDVNLQGAPDAIYRRADGTMATGPKYDGLESSRSAQSAGSAIYTAGVRVSSSQKWGRIAQTGTLVSVGLDSPYLAPQTEQLDFIPSPKALSGAAPIVAHDGGDVSIEAGRDVLGRRDVWSELFLSTGQAYTDASGQTDFSTDPGANIGDITQRWRIGAIGDDTELGIDPRNFTSGIAALGGGNVSISARRNASDLTVSLLSSASTADTDVGRTMMTFGHGDLDLTTELDLLGGRVDIASGTASIGAGRDIADFGREPITTPTPQYLRVRLTDAVVDVTAGGSATLGSISALGVDQFHGSPGFFSPAAQVSIAAVGTASIADTAGSGGDLDYGRQLGLRDIYVLPPSLQMTSLTESTTLPDNFAHLLYPSHLGQLRLYSAKDIRGLVIAMSDADPSTLGGAFSNGTGIFSFPFVSAATTDADLRAQHNPRITHAGDPEPVRIYSNGDIDRVAFILPKAARVAASGDIVDMFFSGQNVDPGDVTRVRAGGSIVGSTTAFGDKPFVRSNQFILGGPGTFIVEAGKDLGPFPTSANIRSGIDGNMYSFAGGIRTVGNDYNPWLVGEGANLSVRFGMAGGADYSALLETYLNPANLDQIDGDLFVQTRDSFGNERPDRSKYIYAPALASWLRKNDPTAFAAIFGNASFPNTDAGNGALADAAYGKMADLYSAFSKVDPLRRQDFLINTLYFGELAAASDVSGPSYQQYVRGYRAVQTLFPVQRGYTDNLAPYTLDPATVSADHPLGEPVRVIVDGQPQRADRVVTGNVDLRLATIQTVRGGDVTILGPGGDVIAGSVVRTSEQPTRRATAFTVPRPGVLPPLESGNVVVAVNGNPITSIPLGYEGVLTLQGGAVRSFTDGSFILNQSRVFSQQNGDITMWSSNGDLNAGQGPKNASNFPPITVRLDENGLAEVDSAGSVSGAGIGTFKRTPADPPSDVILIAPVGEVDAGDAGVRASGNIVVAAARVANADNFKAAGDITGVPNAASTVTIATPSAATSAVAAQAAAAAGGDNQAGRRSLITVDVLGPASGRKCPDPSQPDDPQCR